MKLEAHYAPISYPKVLVLNSKKLIKLTSPAPRNKILCSMSDLPRAFCAARRPARATAAVPTRKTKV